MANMVVAESGVVTMCPGFGENLASGRDEAWLHDVRMTLVGNIETAVAALRAADSEHFESALHDVCGAYEQALDSWAAALEPDW